jgi:hypothetical protein
VNALAGELNQLHAVLAPLAAAEHEISGLGHLFGRHHLTREETAPQPPPGGSPASPAGA